VFLGEAIVLPALVGEGQADTPLGRLAVDDRLYRGKAQVMLRPEQLTLEKSDTASATVGETVFSGSTCEVLVTLDGVENLAFRLDIPSLSPISSGDRVIISVSGAAHLFR
jgi:iron(III) transport system ATP-binding protein